MRSAACPASARSSPRLKTPSTSGSTSSGQSPPDDTVPRSGSRPATLPGRSGSSTPPCTSCALPAESSPPRSFPSKGSFPVASHGNLRGTRQACQDPGNPNPEIPKPYRKIRNPYLPLLKTAHRQGADPHAPGLLPNLGIAEDADSEESEEPFLGWSAICEAVRAGHLGILKRLGPDPVKDDFDELYEHAGCESIVAYLLTMQPPRGLTRILWWHFRWLEDRFSYMGSG
ncbi:MAG: hypothetical protein H6Q06_1175 [Acidobacteria bacterium]|nr:hypothetical protein [Acidobacteriota bacterium]